MFQSNAPHMGQCVLRRAGGMAPASAVAAGACCSSQAQQLLLARRTVSSQANLRGLLSTAKEMASLTVQASMTSPRSVRNITPLPPLRHTLFRSTTTTTKKPKLPVAIPTVVLREAFLDGAKRASATSTAFVSSAVVATVFARGHGTFASPLHTAKRYHHTTGFTAATRSLLAAKPQGGTSAAASGKDNALQGVSSIDRYREEQEEEQRNEQEQEQEDPFNRSSGPGYLPFPPPFHTINVIMFLFIANVLCYCFMNFGNDDMRDFIVEHFTLSHENFHRVYPIFTNALYQENMLQLLIDCWLLWQFGDTMLAFLGNVRLTFFCLLCTTGGSLIHVARQKFELYYGMDELEVRGRCYGPNPMIMGLISMEGLIFRHLNFIQQPPIPFLVLTAFVMVIDVWRIFTTRPEEHGASTGGALMAYLFWALPTRFLGLDKLTATM